MLLLSAFSRVFNKCGVPHPARFCEGWDVRFRIDQVPNISILRCGAFAPHANRSRSTDHYPGQANLSYKTCQAPETANHRANPAHSRGVLVTHQPL
jgi:hypothetical protein